ncbi:MAG: hypothetical protein ACOYD6_02385 [Limnochordia bacterium]
MRYWWAFFLLLISPWVSGQELRNNLELIPQLSYRREGPIWTIDTLWGRDEEHWGFIEGQGSLVLGHFNLDILFNKRHRSINDPFRLVSPGVRDPRKPAVVLTGHYGPQRLLLQYVQREEAHFFGGQWEAATPRWRLGAAAIGERREVWEAAMGDVYGRLRWGLWDLQGAVGMALDGETALLGHGRLSLGRLQLQGGYQALSPGWKSWANWEDPYRHDRHGWRYGLGWSSPWGRIQAGWSQLVGWSDGLTYRQRYVDYAPPSLGLWRFRFRWEEMATGPRWEGQTICGPWTLTLIARDLAAGWDRRVRLQRNFLWGRVVLGWQERESRWRVQLDRSWSRWSWRGVIKGRRREVPEYFYYLRAERKPFYIQWGSYDEGRLDAYWDQDRTLRVGYLYSF